MPVCQQEEQKDAMQQSQIKKRHCFKGCGLADKAFLKQEGMVYAMVEESPTSLFWWIPELSLTAQLNLAGLIIKNWPCGFPLFSDGSPRRLSASMDIQQRNPKSSRQREITSIFRTS